VSEPRPAVVFDINVYIDAVIGPHTSWPLLDEVPPTTDNPAADCLSIAFDAEAFRLVTSPHIITNTTRVLRAAGLSEQITARAIAAIVEIVHTTGGIVVEPPRTVFDIDDHEDNLVLDLAVATDAILVVSTDLTALSPWHSRIAILRPREFVTQVVQTRRLHTPRRVARSHQGTTTSRGISATIALEACAPTNPGSPDPAPTAQPGTWLVGYSGALSQGARCLMSEPTTQSACTEEWPDEPVERLLAQARPLPPYDQMVIPGLTEDESRVFFDTITSA